MEDQDRPTNHRATKSETPHKPDPNIRLTIEHAEEAKTHVAPGELQYYAQRTLKPIVGRKKLVGCSNDRAVNILAALL